MTQPDSTPNTFQDSNTITYLRQDQGDGLLVKQYLRKQFNAKMVKYALLRFLGQEVPVEYWPPAQRRDFEKTCLSLWLAKGFSAPEVRTLPADFLITSPVLGIALIKGERLDTYLANPDLQTADKLSTIANVFAEMHNRHCMAIFEQNHQLIHYDANLRNLLIVNGQPVHIDFEMGHLKEHIDKSAAREVKKITLQVINHLDASLSYPVIRLLMAHYQIHHIVRRMVDEELERPFQRFHIQRDKKKKKKDPGLITKMDLAFMIKQNLEETFPKRTTNTHNQDLIHAIETSWDGRFYQSLDDSDPRGRDMKHRYEVMGFPDSFANCSVLDIGCNIGRICVDAKKRGAKRAIGIDNRKDVVDTMNNYFKKKEIDVSLFAFDINNGVGALESLIGHAPFDYVCVLSIWSHVEKQKLWDIINRYCTKVCFFEDNAPSRINSLEQIKIILEKNLDFSKIEFMGFTTDRGVRAVFRMEK